MDAFPSLGHLIFDPKFWLILGLVLVIVDIFLMSYLLLPIGIASLIMAVLLYLDYLHIWSVEVFSSEIIIWLCFAVLSIASIFLLQVIVKSTRKDEADINQY